MLTIRFSRAGRKHIPFFRIVLTDHRQSAKHGYIKILGSYNPVTKALEFDRAEADRCIAHGAQLSESLQRVLKANGK